MKHHAFLGTYDFDADIPSHWEFKLFGRSALGKAVWLFLFSIMQALRPARLRVLKPIDRWVVISVLAQRPTTARSSTSSGGRRSSTCSSR